MTVIECPKCGSKFKIGKTVLARQTIKMRCSVCSHVFTYSLKDTDAIESDFDELIGEKDGALRENPLQEAPSVVPGETRPTETGPSGIIESPEPEEETPQDGLPGAEEVQPESVIREIDTILGASEALPGEEAQPRKTPPAKGSSLKTKAVVALAVLAVAALGVLAARFVMPSLGKGEKELETPALERGPFFSIPDGSVTYEILANDNEGSVLVVKGVIRKLTAKPLKSILVEARVYDQASTLMESRTAYAGIVPESTELMRQKSSDIDLLLTAEPRTLGVLETQQDIPFAVAFFGKPAREGTSFKVEVKEFHWK